MEVGEVMCCAVLSSAELCTEKEQASRSCWRGLQTFLFHDSYTQGMHAVLTHPEHHDQLGGFGEPKHERTKLPMVPC